MELPVYRRLEDALHRGRVVPAASAHDGASTLIVGDDLPEDAAAMVARTETGHCVFYHRPSGLCVVHRDLGHESLPLTCRHFPRLAVRDGRGTSISLTHYCPTAAAMLFQKVPIRIVADPAAFPPADYEGLVVDADAWPPLLKPTMLMDLASYAAWEAHMVRRCAVDDSSPEDVIATLARDAVSLLDFDPARESLLERVEGLSTASMSAAGPASLSGSLAHHAVAMRAVPDELKPEPDEDGLEAAYARFVQPVWREWSSPLKRYLAAKAFANWTAYQGTGILAIVCGLDAALALVRVEAARQCRDSGRALDEEQLCQAIRGADFILNHLAVGEDLAEAWSSSEGQAAWIQSSV
ncbi:MAG: hypothetical protein ABL986_15735 [Vicinamibacterales bacterium]